MNLGGAKLSWSLVLQRFGPVSGLRGSISKVMLTKRKILVIVGIIVAILITFYTGVFGVAVA